MPIVREIEIILEHVGARGYASLAATCSAAAPGSTLAIRPHILRAVAHAELDKFFPSQAPAAREELVTSVVRQWTTYGGNAGVFTLHIP